MKMHPAINVLLFSPAYCVAENLICCPILVVNRKSDITFEAIMYATIPREL